MKKKLTLVTSAALLLSLGFTMAGCGKGVAKISIEKEGEYTLTMASNTLSSVESNAAVAATANKVSYSFGADDGAGHVIVTETTTGLSLPEPVVAYKVYDLATGQFTNISATTELNVLDKGLFYSQAEKDVYGNPLSEKPYTLYSTNSVGVLPTNETGSVSNGIFTSTVSGSRWYVDIDGEIAQETDPFAIIKTNKNTFKIGKFYVSAYAEGCYHIFDKKGNYERSFDAEYAFGLTKNQTLGDPWLADGNLFFQIKTQLPEYAEEYDYVDFSSGKTEKFNLDTYSYSIKNGKVKEIKKFNYKVESAEYDWATAAKLGLEYNILTVKEIKDNSISKVSKVQSFNGNGKVYYDIQKLVPNATSIDFINNDYTKITDYANFTYVYEKDDCVLTIPKGAADVGFTNSNVAFYKLGTTLYLYDLEEEEVIETKQEIKSASKTYSGDILLTYVADATTGSTKYEIYDVETYGITYTKTISGNLTVDPVTPVLAKTELNAGEFTDEYVVLKNTNYQATTGNGISYSLEFPGTSLTPITATDSMSLFKQYTVGNAYSESYVTYLVFKAVNTFTDTTTMATTVTTSYPTLIVNKPVYDI